MVRDTERSTRSTWSRGGLEGGTRFAELEIFHGRGGVSVSMAIAAMCGPQNSPQIGPQLEKMQ